MNYRLKENRLEGFLRYFYSILKLEEYDPAYYTLNYFYDRYELNTEQRYWLSWLYGFIYNTCSAWVVANEFPDFENVDIERLTDWENKNWMRMGYETDTRYKKGKIQVAFPYYRATVGDQTQHEYFMGICNDPDPKKNFRKLWDTVMSWKLFGRYSAFFYIETLQKCNNLPIEFDSLFLRDIGGSKSHRNGLCYTLGKDEWDMHKANPDMKKYTPEMLDYLESSADELIEVMKDRFPDVAHMVDYSTAETAWCAYKGFFRGRRYLGFYLDRDAKQIKEAESKGWEGIDWDVFWQCRKENIDPRILCENNNYFEPKKEFQHRFVKQEGEIMNLDICFPDEKDSGAIRRKFAMKHATLF